MTLVRLLFHNPPNRCIREAAAAGVSVRGSGCARCVTIGARRGAAGTKCAPNCRHIVLLAAAYSCCLKPQCGHSKLTLTGDDFATVSLKKVTLCPCPERCRLYRLLLTNYVRTRVGCLARLGIAPKRRATSNFRFPDERRPFLNNEARRFQIPLQRAARLELAALAHRDVALNFSVNRDGLGFDLATDVRVLANGQDPIGIDLALHLPVDQKFLLKLDRAFNFDVARKNVFATVFCHMFWMLG